MHLECDHGFREQESLLCHTRGELKGCGRRIEDFQDVNSSAKLRDFVERTVVRKDPRKPTLDAHRS